MTLLIKYRNKIYLLKKEKTNFSYQNNNWKPLTVQCNNAKETECLNANLFRKSSLCSSLRMIFTSSMQLGNQHPVRPAQSAWHICTGLLDIQEQLCAVKRPRCASDLYRTVPVTMKNGLVRLCRGGINVQSILQHFSLALSEFFVSSYLSSLPPGHKTLDITNVKQSCENLR